MLQFWLLWSFKNVNMLNEANKSHDVHLSLMQMIAFSSHIFIAFSINLMLIFNSFFFFLFTCSFCSLMQKRAHSRGHMRCRFVDLDHYLYIQVLQSSRTVIIHIGWIMHLKNQDVSLLYFLLFQWLLNYCLWVYVFVIRIANCLL